jgi:hypothetical protein
MQDNHPRTIRKEQYMKMKHMGKIIACVCLILIMISCEPISVSINAKGEIAFTRSEGAFYLDLKTGKLSVIDWNFGKDTVPAIIRWAPDNDTVALTVRDNINSQDTTLFVADKKGTKKKTYSSASAITQVEWSTDGTYISLSQAGADSDMGVADLVLISKKDGMSKTIVSNAGDVHHWIDGKNILFIKVSEKNKDNSDILKGEISVYSVDTGETKSLTNVIVSKTTGLDFSAERKEIVFTAIKAGEKVDFEADMKAESSIFAYDLKKNVLGDPIPAVIADYVKYSPDSTKLLVKAADSESYGSFDLAFYDLKKGKLEVILKNTLNTVNTNSATVQVYPTWLDNSTVLYWKMTNTYGTGGQAIQLFSINATTLKKQNHQLLIDTEISKLIEKKGGY